MVFGEFQDGQFEGMSVKEIRTHKLECRLREFDIEGEYNAIRHSKKGGGKFANIDRKKVEVIYYVCVYLSVLVKRDSNCSRLQWGWS